MHWLVWQYNGLTMTTGSIPENVHILTISNTGNIYSSLLDKSHIWQKTKRIGASVYWRLPWQHPTFCIILQTIGLVSDTVQCAQVTHVHVHVHDMKARLIFTNIKAWIQYFTEKQVDMSI